MSLTSLALWSTLSNKNPRLRPELTQLALAQAAAPDLDPNVSFEGQSLLELASAWGEDAVRSNDPATWLAPVPEDRVALRLLDRGANPWRPFRLQELEACVHAPDPAAEFINQQGVAPFLAALDQGAWPLVAAFLRHPACPGWDDLFTRCHWTSSHDPAGRFSLLRTRLRKHPEALLVWVDAGLDPNARHPVTGDPILFMAPTADVAAGLVARGADPRARDTAGRTLLARYDQDQGRGAQASDRAQWAQVMGRADIEPRQVWKDALTGSMSKVRPLFERPALMKTWRWDPQDGGPPLTLYDAVGHGRISAPIHHKDSLYSHLTKGMKPTPDISWLAYQPNSEDLPPAETAERLVRAVTAWVTLDQRLANLGFAPSSTQRPGGNEERFTWWVTQLPDSAHRDAVLDQWLRWHDTQPARWGWSGSFIDHQGALRHAIQAWAPRHQVAMLAHRAQWFRDHTATLLSVIQHTSGAHAATLATNQERARIALHTLGDTLLDMFAAKRAAGDTFPAHAWAEIKTVLLESSHGQVRETIEQRWTAWERDEQAADHMPQRSRSRPRY